MSYNSRTADKFVVRFPDGMRTHIEALAKKQHISMNSWMVQRLEAALSDTSYVPTPAPKSSAASWVPRPNEVVEFYDTQGELLHLVVIDDIRVHVVDGHDSTIMIDASYSTSQGRMALVSIPLARFSPL